MLVLSRKAEESMYIGDDIKITVLDIRGGQVRIGITAPRDIRVHREEVYNKIQIENKEAATASKSSVDEASKVFSKDTSKTKVIINGKKHSDK